MTEKLRDGLLDSGNNRNTECKAQRIQGIEVSTSNHLTTVAAYSYDGLKVSHVTRKTCPCSFATRYGAAKEDS